MGVLRVVLKKQKSEPIVNVSGESLLYLRYAHGGRLTYFSTGQHIRPEFWNEKTEQVRRGCPGKGKIEANLINKIDEVNEALRRLALAQAEPTTEALRRELDTGGKPLTFDQIAAAYIAHKEKDPGFAPGSLGILKSMTRIVGELMPGALLDNRLVDRVNSFIAGRSVSTQSNYRAYLKALSRWAIKQGYKVNIDADKIRTRIIVKTVVYFTPDELRQIAQADTLFELTRDLFVFAALTGLRFSDLQRISKAHIDGDFLKLQTQKRGTGARPPLVPAARAIWERYGFEFPSISRGHFNKQLRHVIRDAGIIGPIEILQHTGRGRKFKELPKYEAASSHSAVKSFISNAINAGIPVPAVARMVGKRPEIILQHYSGVDLDEAAEVLKKLFP